MRRAVILATLALLLLAVAGVTAAQEGVFEDAGLDADVTQTTVLENTAPESTGPEPAIPEATATEITVSEETTTPNKAFGAGDEEPSETEQTGEPMRGKSDQKVGKDKGLDIAGKGGQPESAGRAEEDAGDESGGGRKVTVCHKGKKTLTVGAPAKEAHLRHGDSPGACG